MDERELDKCFEAIEAAEDILGGVFGLTPKRKARLNLSTPTGFDRAVQTIASGLRRAAAGDERAAVAASLGVLNVDWYATTAPQRRRLISESMEEAGKHLSLVPSKIEAEIGETMPDVFKAGRADARKTTRSPKVGIKLGGKDKAAIKSIQKDSGLFVTDAMGVRVDAFGDEVRGIVGRGIESGLSQSVIARDIEAAAVGKLTSRGSSYWDVIAGAYVGRGRSWSQLLGYQEAEIKRYKIEAVLDRATTQACRLLHGKSFSVGAGLSILNRGAVLNNPEAIKHQNPWVRVARAEGKKPVLFVEGPDGKIPIATIEEAATGPDERGVFSNELGEAGLTQAGVGFPPYHGLCRTTTIPVI